MALIEIAIQQAAVIPIRAGRICLVKSSSGKRWVVPKGHIEEGQTAGEAGLQEAWEEAGLTGVLRDESIGAYQYEKAGVLRHVTVYVMDVTEIARSWPEQDFRERSWLTLLSALARIEEPGLRKLVRKAMLV